MLLNNHTYFSFKYGTLSPKKLVELSVALGYQQVVVTDINNTSACLNVVRLTNKEGLKPIVGIDFRNGVAQQFVGLAQNNEGFLALNRLLSQHLHLQQAFNGRAPKMKNVIIVYPFSVVDYDWELANHEWIGVKVSDLTRLPFSKWKSRLDKMVILQTATFQNKRDFNAHRLLRAIDNNKLLSQLPKEEEGSLEQTFLSKEGLLQAFAEFPQIIENTIKVVDSCSIHFNYKGTGKSNTIHENKQLFGQSAEEDTALLRKLCYDNLKLRYENPSAAVFERVEKELKVINEQRFATYFLINWDMLRYAREKGYFYVGRGSGANSIVAYCLLITDVDPIELDLYFERFINPFRENPPDFDIDFSWKDRNDVTRYLFEKYGLEHTALVATYSTFQQRAVIRELGKVFGLPKNEIDRFAEEPSTSTKLDDIQRLIYRYAAYLHGFPSHLSVHAGGILIAERPIHYFSATSLPPKGFPITHYSMLEAEDAGLYKFDVLSQRGLGHIRDAAEMVEKRHGITLDIHDVKRFKEDEKVKALLREGQTMGCFYVESPAMRMLLRKLRVDHYLGLVAASSIIRPGVAKSGMMREYILRFNNMPREKPTHPILEELMKETFGVMVYQEDVIKVAHQFAGLTLGEADMLRRGMSGKFRSREEFQKVKDQFYANCATKGYPSTTINEVWLQIESFAGYAFSKGHSASYAVESYQSLYLKAHFPHEFIVGVINNFGGFYSREAYFQEARRQGAIIHGPCVNKSDYLTTLHNEKDIYMGFIHMTDFEERVAIKIVSERNENGDYLDLKDFVNRLSISVEQLRILIRIGAFRFSGKTRQALLWEVHQLLGTAKKSQPKRDLFGPAVKEFQLPKLDQNPLLEVLDQRLILGFPLCSPFELVKKMPEGLTFVNQLNGVVGKKVRMVGYLVTIKNTRTTSRKTMQFGTFVDANGDWIDTVHFPPVAARYPFRGKGCYLIEGKTVEEFGYVTVEVTYLQKLDDLQVEDV
ncbi:DNA polymerase III subunit alpha [Acidiluteibacter ferrifornacis]|uniref:DNA-directed DNA polymerase n=1 Tax=Acidiluteibacter ferrifornacis TaxID=2692424 RepID=A0A6N9NDK1_9FLAO|nr:DNA polymerase III subunit alpha [Acidiluteibacter ferrifornacis]NBG64666.1 DNA polymerase III subunit alpha [Acidiluteibacter ferrifornacis]